MGSALRASSLLEVCAHYINEGHVPDIVRHDTPPHCWEFKTYTPHPSKWSLGTGSDACGGAASTSDGGDFAFGNTEEHLRAKVLGLAPRGQEADGPLDRRTGLGWVKETTEHDYADALSKGHGVTLIGTESYGGFFAPTARILRVQGRLSKTPGTQDSTAYGSSRSSPKAFYPHHAAAISSCIVCADARTILTEACFLSRALTLGVIA